VLAGSGVRLPTLELLTLHLLYSEGGRSSGLFSSRYLPRTAAFRAIRARRCRLCGTSRLPCDARQFAQLLFSTEWRQQQSRHAEIYVQLFPMKPTAARAYLDRSELRWSSLCEIGTGFRGESEQVSVRELHHDTTAQPIIVRGHGTTTRPAFRSSSGARSRNLRQYIGYGDLCLTSHDTFSSS